MKQYICGFDYPTHIGQWYLCWDIHDNYYKHCVKNGYHQVQCLDPTNGKWEWANRYEHDGTPDNSLLTSIHTDGQIWTSPSHDVMDRLDDSVTSDGTTTYHSAHDVQREESSVTTSVDSLRLMPAVKIERRRDSPETSVDSRESSHE